MLDVPPLGRDCGSGRDAPGRASGEGDAVMSAQQMPRRGRGKAKATIALIEACHEILAEIQPATVRAVCYRLFVMGLIPDMGKAATNKVSTQLVWARESGLIPWAWIVDETREAERITVWSNPDEIVDAAKNNLFASRCGPRRAPSAAP
jgi:hypothetical protein